uniref:hypothetical protein n=1 Tax=Eisenbergiella sp. TaxID=1924109 RepID=UPI003AB76983
MSRNKNDIQTSDRKQELMAALDGKADTGMLNEFITHVVFLEEKLAQLRELPFVQVNPNKPAQQRATPAARLYTQLAAQYTGATRVMLSLTNGDGDYGESLLRKWVKEHVDS